MAAVPLLLAGVGPGVAVTAGAAAALLVPDLRERLMLGDTGANPLGAVLGLGVVEVTGTAGQVVALVVLLAVNAASEVVSFSKVIAAVAPLRWLDGVGRVNPEEGPHPP